MKIDDTGLVTRINKNLRTKKEKLEKLNALKVAKLEKEFKLKSYKSKGFEQNIFTRIISICDRSQEDAMGTIRTEADERITFQKQSNYLTVEFNSKAIKIKLEDLNV